MPITETRSSLHQLSPSKLSAFITCPTMFKARYILGIKSPPSASMVLGRAVHAGLELLGRRRQMDLLVAVDDLINEFNETLKADIEGEGLEIKPDELAKLREAGEQLIRLYLGRYGHEKPVSSELHLDEPLIHPSTGEVYQRPSLPGIEPGELSLYGIVDSVLEEPDGLVVVDYKVTARTSADSSVMLTHRMQLLCYAWLMSRASDRPVKALEIRQLVRKKQPDISVTRLPVPGNVSYAPMFDTIDALLATVDGDAYLSRYGFLCHASCDGYRLCSPLA
ncbi:MAG: PD-(D/E)XK nuclease family protein [Planctomycetes bacterium]|nr:PD-(D/E)XK nuclease family protein [Planctomycetota bacterium]